MIERYGANRINPVLIGKSLVYFRDAENDPEPQYCRKAMPKWEVIKRFFIKNVRQMVIDLQKAKEGDRRDTVPLVQVQRVVGHIYQLYCLNF